MPLIRSANCHLFIEILTRIILLSLFCYMETMSPFVRVIHQSDLETIYKYPRHESYVPGGTLWAIVLSAPCLMSLLAWAACNDCNDALEILLAWSLALGINGVLTDMLKLIAGRPRPDFFYRCFPDGVSTPDLQCTGDPLDIMEGRKSFPSGHSSLTFCSLGTVCLWACGRLRVLAPPGGAGPSGRGGAGPSPRGGAGPSGRGGAGPSPRGGAGPSGRGGAGPSPRGGAGPSGRGSAPRLVAVTLPLVAATCVAMSRSCDYHHHWQDILFGSILGFSTALLCYRQYYNPLSSDLSGVPYVVSNLVKYSHGKPDISPVKDGKEENTPLLSTKKEDKWI